MGKVEKMLDVISEKLELSRRSFVKSALALGSVASIYGCSKDSNDSDIVYAGGGTTDAGITSDDEFYTKTPTYRYGTSAHNCGGRCVIKAQVTADGRIARFLTDDSQYAYDGTSIDNSNRNSTQARACARCRAYKARLYHPGRLKYPLKQTSKRGDLSGFVRISWKQALDEVAARLKSVQAEYGAETFHSVYACGNIASNFQGASYTGVFASLENGQSPAIRLLGGSTPYTSDYSFHQSHFMGGYSNVSYSGFTTGGVSMAPNSNTIAGVGKNIVLWGSNITSTVNPLAYPWVKGVEDMKMRDPESKVYFIGPELSDTGVTLADEWIKIKPYTDSALIMAMLHEMIVGTFKADGSLEANPMLDVKYLDTMVYGFFASPAYWVDTTTGVIQLTDGGVGFTKVEEVPLGKSLADYVMGNDDRLSKASYSATDAYVGAQFVGNKRGNGACTYPSGSNSKYAFKVDMNKAKTPAWASAITGIPVQTIKDLAAMYATAGKNGEPIWNEWSGGMLKQAEGCATLFSLHALLIASKNWGITGSGIARGQMGRSKTDDSNQISAGQVTPSTWASVPKMPPMANPSVTQWHNAIKFAFGDELKNNGYVPNIPDWVNGLGTGKVYYNDGGVKALVNYGATLGGTVPDTYVENGRTYYKWKGKDLGQQPKLSGFRFILNSGGNIPVNQHANAIDSAKMFEALPTYGYGDHAVSDMKNAFYMVTFDNFMSPSARYSDYVLPAKTTWEQEDFIGLSFGGNLYIDSVIKGPGESKSTFDFGRDLIKSYGGASEAIKFTGIGADTTFKDVVQKAYNTTVKTNVNSPFYNKTWEQFLEKPFSSSKPSLETVTLVEKSSARASLDAYLAGADISTTPHLPNMLTVNYNTGSGFGTDQFAETDSCPRPSRRFHLYSGSLVWRYENLFSKWHGWLPLEEQGQKNRDEEGDMVIFPIPMYYNYQDYFREAYGLSNVSELDGRFLLTTTHDRYRAHSSQSENPYLRELSHRVVGGGLYSGNDSNEYAISTNPNKNMNEFPALNSLIDASGRGTANATYTEIWLSKADQAGALNGIKDGDLVEVWNEIGAVRCVARFSERCVKGFVGLHQGCWFDPREIGGKTVDVGGNCNTLMASKPSRMDHGNAQQSAMVMIKKVQG